jgi:hypothetical protein
MGSVRAWRACCAAVLVLLAAIATACFGGSSSAPTTSTAPPQRAKGYWPGGTLPAQKRTQPLLLGLQDDAVLTSAEPKAWPLARGLHPRVIRYNVSWNAVAPKAPVHPTDPADAIYNWASTDLLVRNAVQIGAQPLLTIVQSPGWANGGRSPAYAPTDPKAFGAFCSAVATRYSGSFTPAGATVLPRVTRFTVWNEPNRGQYLTPQGPGGRTAPATYAGLARACIDGIRSVQHGADVALGPIASRGAQGGLSPLAFLAAYRHAGGPPAQAVALNPYMNGLAPVYAPRERPADGSVTLRNLDQLELALRAWTGGPVPIWLTEFAWRTAPTPLLGDVSYALQAQLLRRSVAVVQAHEPYVDLLVWFLIRDESPTSYWRSGLVDFAWKPKPAYAVFARLAQAS